MDSPSNLCSLSFDASAKQSVNLAKAFENPFCYSVFDLTHLLKIILPRKKQPIRKKKVPLKLKAVWQLPQKYTPTFTTASECLKCSEEFGTKPYSPSPLHLFIATP